MKTEPIERFKRGTQVIYVPLHAGDDVGHRDCERGFVTSIRKNERTDGGWLVFCRYWSRHDPVELRTMSCSEGTPIARLVIRDTLPQSVVDRQLARIDAEEREQ